MRRLVDPIHRHDPLCGLQGTLISPFVFTKRHQLAKEVDLDGFEVLLLLEDPIVVVAWKEVPAIELIGRDQQLGGRPNLAPGFVGEAPIFDDIDPEIDLFTHADPIRMLVEDHHAQIGELGPDLPQRRSKPAPSHLLRRLGPEHSGKAGTKVVPIGIDE